MKRVILKVNTPGKIEVFTSLETLFVRYEKLRELKFKIDYRISKLKVDFITDNFTIRRVAVNETYKK